MEEEREQHASKQPSATNPTYGVLQSRTSLQVPASGVQTGSRLRPLQPH